MTEEITPFSPETLKREVQTALNDASIYDIGSYGWLNRTRQTRSSLVMRCGKSISHRSTRALYLEKAPFADVQKTSREKY